MAAVVVTLVMAVVAVTVAVGVRLVVLVVEVLIKLTGHSSEGDSDGRCSCQQENSSAQMLKFAALYDPNEVIRQRIINF